MFWETFIACLFLRIFFSNWHKIPMFTLSGDCYEYGFLSAYCLYLFHSEHFITSSSERSKYLLFICMNCHQIGLLTSVYNYLVIIVFLYFHVVIGLSSLLSPVAITIFTRIFNFCDFFYYVYKPLFFFEILLILMR